MTMNDETTTDEPAVIQTRGLSKHFGNIQAVDDVDLDVPKNQIMALVGDNGAGKTTLIKMLCGVLQPTAGEIFVRGEPVSFDGYTDARRHGIETVYQDLGLVEKQKVYENVFLGSEAVKSGTIRRRLGIVDKQHMIEKSREMLDRLDIPVDPRAKVSTLSGGQQQAVAIARALQFDPDIFIMDEPTSALSIEGARNVLAVIDRLKSEGHTILLISHNIDEVQAVSDKISVLANGRLMGVLEAADTTREEIISLMMGASEEGQRMLDVTADSGTEAAADNP